MTLLERAIAVALEAHRGQKDRAGNPYILHPLHLMSRMDDETSRITAVLHDVVEDSDVTLAELRERLQLPPAIATAVDLLTRDKVNESYEAYIERLKPNALARKVKLADLQHNMDLRRQLTVGTEDVERLARYRWAWEELTAVNTHAPD